MTTGTFPDPSLPQELGLLVTATPALLCVRSGIRTSGHLLLVASTHLWSLFPSPHNLGLGFLIFIITSL